MDSKIFVVDLVDPRRFSLPLQISLFVSHKIRHNLDCSELIQMKSYTD